VQVFDIELSGDSRSLPVRVTAPSSGECVPLIVFSHGAGGSGTGYTYLAQHWAEHGYVCVQPTHRDSVEWNAAHKTGKSFVQTMRDMPQDRDAWLARISDILSVIEQVDLLQNAIPELIKIDASRVGLGGHSLGAFIAMLIAGVQMPGAGSAELPVALPLEHKVKALVALSPQGIRDETNPRALAFDSSAAFDSLHLPVLFETGEYDSTGWTVQSQRLQAFESSPAGGDKYLLSLHAANHMTFVGAEQPFPARKAAFGKSLWSDALPAEAGPDQALCRQLIQTTTTLFWDAYLKEDRVAQQSIACGEFERIVGKAGLFREK
jgi:dienelactone hydrolase